MTNRIGFSSGSTKSDLYNVCGSGFALTVSSLVGDGSGSFLVICNNNEEAEQVYKEISFFSGNGNNFGLVFIPDTETLPYDQESPHPAIVSLRSKAFNFLSSTTDRSVVVTSVSNIIQRISSVDYWREGRVDIDSHSELSVDEFRSTLLSFGYKSAKREVSALGEFVFKNSVIDVFPSGAKLPVRIRLSLTGNHGKITSISTFNPNTQRSLDEIAGFSILVAKEMPVTDEAIDLFKRSFRQQFGRVIGQPVYEAVSSGELPSGIEYYLPLFQKSTATIFDLLGSDREITLISKGYFYDAFERALGKIERRYLDIKSDDKRRVLDPSSLWIESSEMARIASDINFIAFHENAVEKGHDCGISKNDVEPMPDFSTTTARIRSVFDASRKTVFCYHSEVRFDQINSLLTFMGVEFAKHESWGEALDSDDSVILIKSTIEAGFYISGSGLCVISERDLFGQPIYAKSEDDLDDGVDYSLIQDLKNLEIDDPVVHIQHGVGRFKGLRTMTIHGVHREYMSISYAKDAHSYVPMDELDYVSRYGGLSTDKAPLDELGSDRWKADLDLAIKDIEQTSRELIGLQKVRSLKKGLAFKKPTFEYQRFCREFPFQETRDQKRAITDIINDMISDRPMDRTIVGDVGFGKTEVAMRAAFIAAMSGHQVAVVVPTSLLAKQHYDNFTSRFASSGMNIAYLSNSDRVRERKVLADMKSGKANIVISTHRMLQDDVVFKSLGLLVIDEEHRFGVKDKEKLRHKRENIDVLSMTATPIPRTLGMSMGGIRDLSIISTPPAKRLAIRTIVDDYNDDIVKEAIQRELMRKGQVFFLHNRTESIDHKADEIRALVPGLRVAVCHGKMTERQIEAVMGAFYKREFDLLVCTTIIETGIDVPNSNTIIIDGANNFGIAQLHQLRGRVGRSHHQAYAYLLKSKAEISDDASKRLSAMEKATSLGDGFVLANHDLEIRGSGELLGEDQSGHIHKIGFALYMRLLNRAIEVIKNGGKQVDVSHITDSTKLDINVTSLIDSKYVENEQERLSYYKRFASANSLDDIDEISAEMEDKYGESPVLTENLVKVSKLRSYLRQSGVKKLIADDAGCFVQVYEDNLGLAEKLVNFALDYDDGSGKVVSPTSIEFKKETSLADERLEYIVSLIADLT